MKLYPVGTSVQMHPTNGRRFVCLMFAIICAALIYSSRTASAAGAIVTDQGPLKGLAVAGEREYLGIPYAAPPVGSLRWLPPEPPARFKGLFHATQFGSVCTQLQGGVGPVTGSEDCLYLNVYMPDVEPPAHGFPVMVWIHGGSLVIGAGSEYDPTPLVENGNVIVVTINYRLGLLGFFAHPAIDAEGHLKANYGLMDQQFALGGVRRNIAAFGGDYKRVTIFGESAGGFSVLSNVASPTAAGLFQGGIVESGAYAEFQDYWDMLSLVPLATAETIGTVFVPAGTVLAANVGCPGQTAQTATCLRATPASTLVDEKPGLLFPIIDGTVLTQNLDSAFADGEFNLVPIINGTTHDESREDIASEYDLAGHPLSDAGYPAAVYAYFGLPYSTPDNAFVDDLINVVYPLTNYPPPARYSVSAPLALGALETDILLACTARKADLSLSHYVPTYMYEFHDETAPSFSPYLPAPLPPLSFPLGAAHGVELQYLFDLGSFGIRPAFTSDQQQLSDTMIGYWTKFAKTGNPNSEGEPNWALYTGAGGQFESLIAPTPTTESDASFDTDHKCSSFWIHSKGEARANL
jgi:para-nitrobenzyl esterase